MLIISFLRSKLSAVTNSNCNGPILWKSDAVPPVYYAHLAAFRARFYMGPDLQENGSIGHAGKGTRTAGESGVRPLPALKENVKRVMFYC